MEVMADNRVVFVDTNYWIALLLPKDNNHVSANNLKSTLFSAKMVTSELVLAEFLNFFSKKGHFRTVAHKAVVALRQHPNIVIVSFAETPFDEAFDQYGSYPDKEWSLVDCSSFCLMRKRSISSAASYDKHFQQSGFEIIS